MLPRSEHVLSRPSSTIEGGIIWRNNGELPLAMRFWQYFPQKQYWSTNSRGYEYFPKRVQKFPPDGNKLDPGYLRSKNLFRRLHIKMIASLLAFRISCPHLPGSRHYHSRFPFRKATNQAQNRRFVAICRTDMGPVVWVPGEW